MRFGLILFYLLVNLCSHAQQLFTLRLQHSALTVVPAVHSGAFGSYKGKWFFVGGRKNGLHGFQPAAAFDLGGVNDSIYFVDPHSNQRWSASVFLLPDSIREPVTSSNMQFYLQDSMLYMVGGYGWKDAVQDFVTWPALTAVNISALETAVINNQPISPCFRQISDSVLAVCGAHLNKIDSVYFLVFGHRFDGIYNRTDSTGFFRQQYTNEVRKFQIADDGLDLSIYNYTAVHDASNFRRRDYNLIPQLYPWGEIGLCAFGGVFQPTANLPYLTPIEIFDTNYIVRNDFNQNLNQYHSAVCAIYDSINMLQHNIFFGGISMYYIDSVSGNTVTDSLVPFVNTISNVVRDLDFNFHEIDAVERMPALLGTNAYFFLNDSVPLMRDLFVHLNLLPNEQRIGFITGGIESPELNVSETDPTLSFASARVFDVYLKRVLVGIDEQKPVSNAVLNFFVYPNPAAGTTEVQFDLTEAQQVKIELLALDGKLVQTICDRQLPSGKQKLLLDMSAYAKGVYNCVLTVKGQRKSIRLAKD